MIDMDSKYDNMHKSGMFYALICIDNHIIICMNYMLSISKIPDPTTDALLMGRDATPSYHVYIVAHKIICRPSVGNNLESLSLCN